MIKREKRESREITQAKQRNSFFLCGNKNRGKAKPS
ncbi:unnamed protein product [Brassica rapa subsp. narinosa]